MDVSTGFDDIALNAYQRGTKKFKAIPSTWELVADTADSAAS